LRRAGTIPLLCATALGCGSPQYPGLWRALLDAPDWRLRAYSVQSLAPDELSDIDLQALGALAVRDPSAAVRQAVIAKLGANPNPSVSALLVEILQGRGRPGGESSMRVRAAAAMGLAHAETRFGLYPLVDCLGYDDRPLREACDVALEAISGRSQAERELRERLGSGDGAVRAESVRRLALLRVSGLGAILEKLARTDSDPNVRGDALRAMKRLDLDPDRETLQAGLRDAAAPVRARALAFVAESSPFVDDAASMLKDPDASVRAAAGKALVRARVVRGTGAPWSARIESSVDRLEMDPSGSLVLERTQTLAMERVVGSVETLYVLVPQMTRRVVAATVDGSEATAELDREYGDREVTLRYLPRMQAGEAHEVRLRLELEPSLERAGSGRARLRFEPGPWRTEPDRTELRVFLPVPFGDVDARPPAPISSESSGASVAWCPSPESVEIELPAPAGAMFVRHSDPMRDWATAMAWVLLGAAGVAWAVRRAWRRAGPRDDELILAVVVTGVAAVLLQPLLVEDNLAYLAYARSLLLDGNLNVWDDYYLRNPDAIYAPDPRLPYGPTGASLFWIPLLAGAHALNRVAGAFGAGAPADGTTLPYLAALQVGAAAMVGVAWCLAFRMARRRFGRFASLAGVIGIGLGTNALLMLHGWTASTHAPTILLVTWFLYLLDRPAERPRTTADWLLAGLVGGLMVQTRVQNVALLPLAGIVWLAELRRCLNGRKPHEIRGLALGALRPLAVFGAGVLVGEAPQLAASWSLDGSAVADLYGVSRHRFSAVLGRVVPMFLGGRPDSPFLATGVLTAMPILVVAGAGLVRATRRDRLAGLVWWLAVAGQMAVVLLYPIWWGRVNFGTPYFVNLFAPAAIGLAAAVDWIGARWRPWPVLAGLVLLALPSLRAVLLESCARLDSVPYVATPLWEHLRLSIFLPDVAMRESVLERHGGLATPTRAFVEAVWAGRWGAFVPWLAGLVLVAGALWLWASRPTPRLRSAALPAAVLAAAMAGFTAWIAAAGLRTNLEYAVSAHYDTASDYEVIPLLRVGAGKIHERSVGEDVLADRVDLVTFTRDTTGVAQGSDVARVTLQLTDGRSVERVLHAGAETADAEVENPSRAGMLGHGPAERPIQHRIVRDRSTASYRSSGALTTVAVDPPGTVRRVKVECVAPQGEIWVTHVVVSGPAPKPPWREWRAGRWRPF